MGEPLPGGSVADALRVGVLRPEEVRLLRVESIPVPNEPTLAEAAGKIGLISPATWGLTLRYGIFIRSDHWGSRRLLVHELAHTVQYERLGGIEPFLRDYLGQCLVFGYPAAPMEQEAIAVERQVCD